MESITSSSSLHTHFHHKNLIYSPHLFSTNPSIISFPYCFPNFHSQRFYQLKSNGNGSGGVSSQQEAGGGYGSAELLRKPVSKDEEEEEEESDYEDDGGKRRDEDRWIDWEDQILEDTVPLVGFVRMILHSDKYASGERLSPEHERTIVERLLPHHPESEKKIGCGISYITVGYHPDFESSRCLFIVRKDGEMVDFSYWKCIKGLIRKNYPLYADSFILRHFRRRRHND